MNRYKMLPTYRYYEAEGYPLSLGNTAGKPLRNYRIYGNTVDGVGVGEPTKNLLDIRKGASKTERGITYTNNGDGTITLNGTFNSTTYTYYQLKNYVSLEPGKTYTYGCGQELNNYGVRMYVMVGLKNADSGTTRYVSSDNVRVFTLADNESVTLFEFRTALRDTSIFPTLTNVILTPFLYEGEHEPVYEPYSLSIKLDVDGTKINIPINSRLNQGDYIDYKADNLPTIPTKKFQNNTLTVQSNVPPSKIWCEYYK